MKLGETKVHRWLTKIDYVFKDPDLLDHVIRRVSYGQDAKGWPIESLKCFERLEFLGDAVLNMVVSDMLFRKFPNEPRGVLTTAKQTLVCSNTLMDVCESIGLHRMFYRKGKYQFPSKSILENAIEALIGAIYVDGGFFKVRNFIVNLWGDKVENSKTVLWSSKNALQMWTQKYIKVLPRYHVIETIGPKEKLRFKIKASVQGVGRSYGVGTSKREAETIAAFNLINKINKQGYGEAGTTHSLFCR